MKKELIRVEWTDEQVEFAHELVAFKNSTEGTASHSIEALGCAATSSYLEDNLARALDLVQIEFGRDLELLRDALVEHFLNLHDPHVEQGELR